MRRSAFSAAVLATFALTLTGCFSSGPNLEQKLTEIDHVQGAWVKTTTSGFPTNRGLLVRLYLDDQPGESIDAIAVEALQVAWVHSSFRPSNGISLQMEVGERPDEPRAIDMEKLVDLRGESEGLDIFADAGFGTLGSSANFRHATLKERFGEWSDD